MSAEVFSREEEKNWLLQLPRFFAKNFGNIFSSVAFDFFFFFFGLGQSFFVLILLSKYNEMIPVISITYKIFDVNGFQSHVTCSPVCIICAVLDFQKLWKKLFFILNIFTVNIFTATVSINNIIVRTGCTEPARNFD